MELNYFLFKSQRGPGKEHPGKEKGWKKFRGDVICNCWCIDGHWTSGDPNSSLEPSSTGELLKSWWWAQGDHNSSPFFNGLWWSKNKPVNKPNVNLLSNCGPYFQLFIWNYWPAGSFLELIAQTETVISKETGCWRPWHEGKSVTYINF